jgi:chemotaxis protein methyltransferase CheR
MQLTPENIEYIFDYIEKLCGIALDDTKGYLIDARLGPLLKKHSAKDAVELIDKAKSAAGDPIRKSLVEAMTTRETFFFRDNSPFEALQFKALPEVLDVKFRERNPRLRIWSAAASSGQEACSIAIVLHEMIPDLHRWDIQILATDISDDAVARGRAGVYSTLEVERGLPKPHISKYFVPHKYGYQVVDSVHRMIRFQQLNLLEPFHFPIPFDIIFCRNVAIYFEKKVKIDLFRRMLPIMPRHGYLFVGVSESLYDCGPEFKPQHHCKSTFYQPNLAACQVTGSPPLMSTVSRVTPAPSATPRPPSNALPTSAGKPPTTLPSPAVGARTLPQTPSVKTVAVESPTRTWPPSTKR